MTDKDLDKLEEWKCEHNYEQLAPITIGNSRTYRCVQCGATRTVKVGSGFVKTDPIEL